jgi:hypothetical protein
MAVRLKELLLKDFKFKKAVVVVGFGDMWKSRERINIAGLWKTGGRDCGWLWKTPEVEA